MVQSMGQSKTKETDSKEIQIFELLDRECKITAKPMFNELRRMQTTKRNQENDVWTK